MAFSPRVCKVIVAIDDYLNDFLGVVTLLGLFL